MKKYLLVSIMIPFYNSEKTILKCLNSVKDQTYKKIEIVLVNDGSKDKTLSIIRSFKKKFKELNIRIINIKHIGITGKVFNIGLRNCRGDLVFKLDSDMWIDKYFIQEIINCFSEDVVGCQGVWGMDPNKKYSFMEKLYIVNRLGNLLYEDKKGRPGVNIFRKLKNLEWGNIGYAEDIVFLESIRKEGKLETISTAKIYHQEPQNFSENVNQWAKYGKYKYRSLKRKGRLKVLLSEIYFLIPILIILSIFFPYMWIITGLLLVYLLNRLIIKANLALKNLKKYTFLNLFIYVSTLLGLKIINSYITLISLLNQIF